MKITKLTDNGKVERAAISGDGRYVAYALRDKDQQSLWVRQVATESAVQLVAQSSGSYRGITFSPDGNFIYFVHTREGASEYNDGNVIPALGGNPRLIVHDIDHAFGLSPDGKSVAFVRNYSASQQSRVLVANSDGTGEHMIAEALWSKSGMFSVLGVAPSWSPDGQLIAVPFQNAKGKYIFICHSDGSQPVMLPFVTDVWGASWVPDQSGLLVEAGTLGGGPSRSQIWLQPFPKGDPVKITNDLNSYGPISITADGKQFATLQDQEFSTIYVGTASRPNEAAPLGTSRSDGFGLAWVSGQKFLSMDEKLQFWITSADGKDRTTAFRADEPQTWTDFSVCGSGSFAVLTRSDLIRANVWRVDLPAGTFQRLTDGEWDFAGNCSPDGKNVIYTSRREKETSLMSIPAAGGSPVVMLEPPPDVRVQDIAQYSPDGTQIAFEIRDGPAGQRTYRLAVVDSATHRLTRKFGVLEHFSHSLRWTPDGRGLTYVTEEGNTANLWMQPVSGGKPQQITHFPDDVFAYAWSPDGKRIALTRATYTNDVVLFSDFH